MINNMRTSPAADDTNNDYHHHHHNQAHYRRRRQPDENNKNNLSTPKISHEHHHQRTTSTSRSSIRLFIICPILTLTGLYIFSTSFFLAKRSMPHISSCNSQSASQLLQDGIGMTKEETDGLVRDGILSSFYPNESNGDDNDDGIESKGCWMPRRVDAMVIIVVDALRFDFALEHLPKSVGARLAADVNGDDAGISSSSNNNNDNDNKKQKNGQSQLFKFMADPPTVTMQRLKGLTTGGLPTFADISNSFGGATVDEDSWVAQLRNVPFSRRRHSFHHHHNNGQGIRKDEENTPKIAFVGDDTWVDLFPTQFHESFPFPSFNTRDLDTVDNGCLKHLPRMLASLATADTVTAPVSEKHVKDQDMKDVFEVVVAHFLGVDHVGHTYGPHDVHMDNKLRQMDDMLESVFETMEDERNNKEKEDEGEKKEEGEGKSCRVAFVFGDHGMTEDGNHGGGTDDETNAALFVHFSSGCGEFNPFDITGSEVGSHSINAFRSIHQIDLVPTISILLGLPIPYANLGGLVPAILPPRSHKYNNGQQRDEKKNYSEAPFTAAALALNAAQVWNYLTTYSNTANALPSDSLTELESMLKDATTKYKAALALKNNKDNDGGDDTGDGTSSMAMDAMAYREACGLFKVFLSEATELGKKVWTRFDTVGMAIGIAILIVSLLLGVPSWEWARSLIETPTAANILSPKTRKCFSQICWSKHLLEVATILIFMIYQCIILMFSNSYIEHEHEIIMYTLSIQCILISIRWLSTESSSRKRGVDSAINVATHRRGEQLLLQQPVVFAKQIIALQTDGDKRTFLPLIVALCSRLNDLFITGHGLDPSLMQHAAHVPAFFFCSLCLLAVIRILMIFTSTLPTPHTNRATKRTSLWNIVSPVLDLVAIICLAFSWWEKRSRDRSRNGYLTAFVALSLSSSGFIVSVVLLLLDRRSSNVKRSAISSKDTSSTKNEFVAVNMMSRTAHVLFKLVLFIVIVTGPSAAASAVLLVIQSWALFQVTATHGNQEVQSPVIAALWRLIIRHAFFSTGHACSFNRLHYSAAFVATETFYFIPAGISLFLNTFGWEIVGSVLVLMTSKILDRYSVWKWFCFYQLMETVGACISVSIMRRHLMVWAIFAPRFVFASSFTIIINICYILHWMQ